MQKGDSWGIYPLPLIGWVYIRMAELNYEWNQLKSSLSYVTRGIERAELGGDIRAMIAGCITAGRVKLTEGDHEAAASYLEKARPLISYDQFPDWISRCKRLQLEIQLSEDRAVAIEASRLSLLDTTKIQQPDNYPFLLKAAQIQRCCIAMSYLNQAEALACTLLDTANAEGS